MTTTTLGTLPLPDPMWDHEGFELELQDIGVLHDLANGSKVYDYVGTRYACSLKWHGLTSAQKNTIYSKYLVKVAQAFVGPDGTNFWAVVVPNSWKESYVEDGDGTGRYECEMRLVASGVIT